MTLRVIQIKQWVDWQIRSWAETLCWMEELELKHIELRRTIKSFETMSTVWNSISVQQSSPGAATFVKNQSTFFGRMQKLGSLRE